MLCKVPSRASRSLSPTRHSVISSRVSWIGKKLESAPAPCGLVAEFAAPVGAAVGGHDSNRGLEPSSAKDGTPTLRLHYLQYLHRSRRTACADHLLHSNTASFLHSSRRMNLLPHFVFRTIYIFPLLHCVLHYSNFSRRISASCTTISLPSFLCCSIACGT